MTALEDKKNRSDIMKNYFEVVALIFAGLWALYTFLVKDTPALEPHAELQTDLVWQTRGGDCVADWNVSLKNIGTSAFDVSDVTVYMWQVDPTQFKNGFVGRTALEGQKPNKLNPVPLTETDPTAPDPPLIAHYSPNAGANHSFEWIFKTYDKRKWIVLTIDIKRSIPLTERLIKEPYHPFCFFCLHGPKQERLTYAYQWDEMCRSPEEKEPQLTIIRRSQ